MDLKPCAAWIESLLCRGLRSKAPFRSIVRCGRAFDLISARSRRRTGQKALFYSLLSPLPICVNERFRLHDLESVKLLCATMCVDRCCNFRQADEAHKLEDSGKLVVCLAILARSAFCTDVQEWMERHQAI